MLTTLVILVILLALFFDYTNGFHDAANAIATVVSTRALKPRQALLLSAFWNLVGSIIGVGVAQTIAKQMVDLTDITHPIVVVTIILAALVGAITWNLITWWFGLPSSSSHSLIGGLAGAGVAAAVMVSNDTIQIFWYKGIVQKVIEPMVISPAVGFTLAFLVMCIFLRFLVNKPYFKIVKRYKYMQIVSASAMSLGHGLQDAQKSMGIIFLCTSAIGWTSFDADIPIWVRVSCGLAISLGTFSGGTRIMKTLGRKIIKLDPVKGFVAETVASVVLFVTALSPLHVPISTTHTITMSLMGAGATKNAHAVKWGVAGNIVLAWILTIPAAAVVAAACYFIISLPMKLFGVF